MENKNICEFKTNDIIGDFTIINITKKERGRTYIHLQCNICKREKELKLTTIRKNKFGETHKSCGKGIKVQDKRFYNIWQQMRTRTTNPNYHRYDRYGGRNITSQEFENFIDFYDAMYTSYIKHIKKYGEENTTLERIDLNKNYCKENCKWATWIEQQSNTSRNKLCKGISPEGIEYEFNNQREFARQHNLSDKCINDCLQGKSKTHKKWIFQYIEKSVTTNENII